MVHWGVNRFRYRGAWHTAASGALCTVTPDEVHTVEPAGEVGFAYRCIYPPAALVQEVAASVAGRAVGGTLLLPPVIQDGDAARLATRLLSAIEAGAPSLATQGLLAALLAHVVGRHAVPRVGGARLPAPGEPLSR